MWTVCSFQRLVYMYLRNLKGTCRNTTPLMSLTVRFPNFLCPTKLHTYYFILFTYSSISDVVVACSKALCIAFSNQYFDGVTLQPQ